MQGRTAIAKILKIEGIEFISGFPQNAIFEAGAEEGIRPIIAEFIPNYHLDGLENCPNLINDGLVENFTISSLDMQEE